MRLTNENARVRWLGLAAAWAVISVVLYFNTVWYRDYVGLLNRVGTRAGVVPATPMNRICPTMYADTQMWVRHSLALIDGAGPQLRYTQVDNAPLGREVHWSSGFAWMIAGAGELRHLLFGEPLAKAVEESLAWINLPLFLAFIIGFSLWVAKRAGLGAGVLVAFLMFGHSDFYSGFAPNYVDHHGVLAGAVFGVVLGALFMGIGYYQPTAADTRLLPSSRELARQGAIISAASGAVGLWFSAATLIPAIAIVGFAGAFTMIVCGNTRRGGSVILDSSLWRLWGKVGSLLAFAFYLIEYAPGHLGFRLEVNHPLYALGWWGGSEIIAQIADWRSSAGDSFRFNWKRIALAAGVIAITPLTVLVAGEKVFVVFDPFISRLSAHVAEGISLPKSVEVFGWLRIWMLAPWVCAAVALAIIMAIRSDRADRPLVVFAIVSFAGFMAMAWAQLRWLPSASGPAICLILLGAVTFGTGRWKWLPWTFVAGTICVLTVPAATTRMSLLSSSLAKHAVDKSDAIQPVFRDIAAVLRDSQPTGDIVILASPNASVAVSYYGNFKSLGTLYWENLEGTKVAARMFSADGEVAARKLLRERGVTHVVMVSQDNFLAEYYELLKPTPKQEEFNRTFGYQVLFQQQVPIWLEQIPYEAPADIPARPERIMLFKVKFSAPDAEKVYASALIDFDAGNLDEGERKLDRALELDPKSAEFWLIKAHVVAARKDFAGAMGPISKAIENASPIQRFTVATGEANRLYAQHAHLEAAQLFRYAFSLNQDHLTANNLAWLLATSTDDRVRNGAEAVNIMEQLMQHHSDYTYTSAYAAALAEAGRFEDAVKVAQKALEFCRATKNEGLVLKSEQRLAAYKAGRAWRE